MMKKCIISIFCALLMVGFSHAQYNSTLKIDYFGQTPPGKKAVVFSPDFISRKGWYVQNGCFSQDGKEFVFCKTDSAWSSFKVMYTSYSGDRWTEPVELFPEEKNLGMPFFSYDNSCLFFSSSVKDVNHDGDIYLSKRNGDRWERPIKIGYPVSSDDGNEWEVSVSRNGTLYYSSSRPGGSGGYDVYRSKKVSDIYPEAENLGKIINGNSLDECPYIVPDESLLVYNSWRYNPRFKGNNLYISYQNKDGSWSQPKDLGNDINTDELDIYPYITPDGKYLMFTRAKNSKKNRFSQVYWVSADVLDSVKNSAGDYFRFLSLSAAELKKYTGVYTTKEYSVKVIVDEKENDLIIFFNGSQNPISMAAIEKDTFWEAGHTFTFDTVKGTMTIENDMEGTPTTFTKQH